MQPAPSAQRFFLLDALRGLAAFAVVLRHEDLFFGAFSLPESYLVVDLFFGLSGFVLAHTYERKLVEGLSPWRFILSRFIRFYPLYILGTLAGIVTHFALFAMHGEHLRDPSLWLSSLSALFLLPGYGGSWGEGLYPINVPVWMLLFELAANAVYALAIRYRMAGNRPLLGFVAVCGVWLVAAASSSSTLNLGWDWDTVGAAFPRACFSFFLGVLLYRHWSKAERRPLQGGQGIAASLGIAICLYTLMSLAPSREWQLYYDILVGMLVFPALIYVGASVRMGPRLAAVASFLGLVSYAIYVLHVPFFGSVKVGFAMLSGQSVGAFAPWGGIAVFACLALVSKFLEAYYNVPLRNWILARVFPAQR
jgi:peptidoglycan/LPS O-acetylase OafA/YrhL